MISSSVFPSPPLPTAVAIPSVEGREARLVGTEVGPMPWLVAYDGQDSLAYAKAAAGMGPRIGNTVSHVPSQRLNQAFLNTQGIPVTSYPNRFTFGVSLPPSFLQARNYAERANRRHHPQLLASIHPVSAEMTPDQTLASLYELAKWPRLRNTIIPEPAVGGLEVDPAGIVDRLGIKGMSVYTAFIDRETLRCRVCGQGSDTMDVAVHHERHARHYQA